MTFDDLNNYYNKLLQHLNSDQLFSVSNSDRAHNATVMRFMLDTCPDINMFCGEMSVFRDNFYNYVNESHGNNLGNMLKEQVEDSIREFVDAPDRKLRIIIANYEDLKFSDLLAKSTFISGIADKKIELYRLDKRCIFADQLKHCTYSERGVVRMEEDQESHKGICSIHIDEGLLSMLRFNFDTMLSASERLELPLS